MIIYSYSLPYSMSNFSPFSSSRACKALFSELRMPFSNWWNHIILIFTNVSGNFFKLLGFFLSYRSTDHNFCTAYILKIICIPNMYFIFLRNVTYSVKNLNWWSFGVSNNFYEKSMMYLCSQYYLVHLYHCSHYHKYTQVISSFFVYKSIWYNSKWFFLTVFLKYISSIQNATIFLL